MFHNRIDPERLKRRKAVKGYLNAFKLVPEPDGINEFVGTYGTDSLDYLTIEEWLEYGLCRLIPKSKYRKGTTE